jgi:nucleoside-diphosphate-sugar epimerase
MTSTLITGGMGYLGRNVVARLAAAGEPVVSYNRDFSVSELAGVTCVQGELYDLPRLVDTLRRHDVGRIVHTAAMSHPELSVELPITTVTANVDGTVHVFEAARMAGVKRIVNFSSECAYGHVEGPVREDAPLHPTTPYGVTKVTTELLGHVYTDLYGLDVVSLRPTELYGPGNKMPQYLREMIRAALDGEPYRLAGGADQRFHFVHVDDVARATELAAAAAEPRRRVYNITGGVHVPLAEAAAIVRDAIPGADIEVGPGLLDLDQQGPYDISAAAAELGYEPQWSLDAGLRSYIDHLRENRF